MMVAHLLLLLNQAAWDALRQHYLPCSSSVQRPAEPFLTDPPLLAHPHVGALACPWLVSLPVDAGEVVG